ncbi:MAG: hypothetical protein PHW69_07305 [Elusimicrobiaceae bacterium]|nr:hypothetical protein [Elusimicrobiaceae bacterium]
MKIIPFCLLVCLCGCAGLTAGNDSARAEAVRRLRRLAFAADLYKSQYGVYPDSAALFSFVQDRTLGLDPWGVPPGLDIVPSDRVAERGADFRLTSAGPDRRFGTGDDIGFPVR